MTVFVNAQGIKTVREGGWFKNSVHIVVECPLGKFHLTCSDEPELEFSGSSRAEL